MKINRTDRGLGIPEDYFSNLDESIFKEIECLELEKEIDIAAGRKTGFKVPLNFFDEFTTNSYKFKNSTKLRRLFISGIYIAASLVLVFTIIQLNSSKNHTGFSDKSFNDLLAESNISEDYLDFLELEELTTIYTEIDYKNMAAYEASSESIDLLFEDDDF